MLRFRPTTNRQNGARRVDRTARQNRLRLWLLLAALGLVVVTMNRLQQPTTALKLQQLFDNEEPGEPSKQPFVLDSASSTAEIFQSGARAPADKSDAQLQQNEIAGQKSWDPSTIKDNTYFRPQEREAWFGALAQLQDAPAGQAEEGQGESLSYIQLKEQPEAYRGQWVNISGLAGREETVKPAANSLGIESLHRLWIQPAEGGQWPFVVFCLKLPEAFPRGDGIRETVSVTGIFFKNWSYPWEDGLGLAPVILARNIDWKPPAPPQPPAPPATGKLVLGAAGALCVAGLIAWLAVRRTRRRPRSAVELPEKIALPDDTATQTDLPDQLQHLAEQGGDA